METLRAMLPQPLSDTPEDWACRDRVGLATVAATVPASPADGRLPEITSCPPWR
jgi:hypothetical protein